MTRLKREHVLGLLIGVLLLTLLWTVRPAFENRTGPAVAVGDEAPDFQLPSESGQPVGLKDFRGRFLVLNFWATWCRPCVEEMPSLNQFHHQFASRGVVVLGVSVDRDSAVYGQFLKKAGVQFQTLRDPERRVSRLYGTFKYPETYFIDRQGKVVQKIIGPADWTDPKMADYMNDLLKG